jgi:hypothetical protein
MAACGERPPCGHVGRDRVTLPPRLCRVRPRGRGQNANARPGVEPRQGNPAARAGGLSRLPLATVDGLAGSENWSLRAGRGQRRPGVCKPTTHPRSPPPHLGLILLAQSGVRVRRGRHGWTSQVLFRPDRLHGVACRGARSQPSSVKPPSYIAGIFGKSCRTVRKRRFGNADLTTLTFSSFFRV